jgi:MFS family permease
MQSLLPGSSGGSRKGRYNRVTAGLIFLFPALGGLLFGYDIGATSAVIAQLTSKEYSGTKWWSTIADSSVLQGVVTSIAMFGAMLGSTTCFQIADDLGRRRTLIIGSAFFMVGGIVEALSGNSSWNATAGISVLVTGRVLYGYGCGFAMHGAPAYIGEMAPSEIRGLLVSLKEAFIVLGMVMGYTIGYLFSSSEGGWRKTYIASLPLSIVMMAGMFYLPYSARWLALKGRVSEARDSLRFVTPDISETELQAVQEVADKASLTQASGSTDWKRLTAPSVWPALVAGVGLVFLQQVTGQPSVLYYADSIFEPQTALAAVTASSRVLMRVRVVASTPAAPPRDHSAICATTVESKPRCALAATGLGAEGTAAPPEAASVGPPPAEEAVRGADAGAPVAPTDAAAAAAGLELLFRLVRWVTPLAAA